METKFKIGDVVYAVATVCKWNDPDYATVERFKIEEVKLDSDGIKYGFYRGFYEEKNIFNTAEEAFKAAEEESKTNPSKEDFKKEMKAKLGIDKLLDILKP